MTPSKPKDQPAATEKPMPAVRLSISDETLADLVEIALRLDGIAIEEEPSARPGLIVTDPPALQESAKGAKSPQANDKTLLLVADETDIPAGIEYLVVPVHGEDYDLDPELLVTKVRAMLSGRRRSAERNPVTHLPGAAAFEAEIRERLSTGERFGVVFADLNQFKSYNKAYSYTRGDQMLVAVGDLMQKALDRNPHPQNFLAHLGSDDFALITSEKIAPTLAEEIVDSFDEMIASFYDVSDLTRGSIIITDRKGNEVECPIVTIALAVILSSRRSLGHPAEAIDLADELLRYLKSRDVTESCCIVERASAKS
jgi:diguanylate cyclase (GGDEF)-like protein